MIYIAAFYGDTGVTSTKNPFDAFELTAPSNSDVIIRELKLGQFSDFGDAAAEILGVRFLRYRGGDTGGGGSGGPKIVPRPKDGRGDTGAAGSLVFALNDTGATDTGIAGVVTELLLSDSMNIAAGLWHYPPEEEMIVVRRGDRFVVRVSGAADALSMTGTLVFEEIGKTLP